MRWRLAARRAWQLPVVWVASTEEPPALTATAETASPPAQVVHYHLHLPPGADLSALMLALPPGSIVAGEE